MNWFTALVLFIQVSGSLMRPGDCVYYTLVKYPLGPPCATMPKGCGLPHQSRISHVFRLQKVIEPLLCEPAFGDDQVIDAAAGLERFFGNGGGFFVPEHRIQRGDEANGVLHVFPAPLAIGFD